MMNFKKNKTLQNIFTLSMGTVGAQMVNFLGQLFITRIYLPNTLGEFTLILSLVQLFVPISSLKMEMRLVTSKTREEANSITTFSILLNCMIVFIFYMFIFLNELLQLGFFESIGKFIYFIPIMIFTNGLRYIFISYSNFENEYKIIGQNQFIRELIFVGLQVILGLIWPNTLVIILSFIISPLFGVKEQGLHYFKSMSVRTELKSGIGYFFENIKKFKSHILFQVPSQFANTFSYTVITLTIAAIATESDIAFYNLSVRILMIPLVLVSNNLSKVYMKEMINYRQKGGNYFSFYLRISGILILVSIIGFTFLYFIAPPLMGILFGEAYVRTGTFISLLCLMYTVRFVTSSLVGTFVVFNRQGLDFVLQMVLCTIGVVGFIYANYNNLDVISYLHYVNYSYAIVYIMSFFVTSGLILVNYLNEKRA